MRDSRTATAIGNVTHHTFQPVLFFTVTAQLRRKNLSQGWFPLPRNFYARVCIKFTFTNKIEAMYVRSHVSVKVEPRTTSRLISTLYILPLFYLRDLNSRVLMCVANNASVDVNLNMTLYGRREHKGTNLSFSFWTLRWSLRINIQGNISHLKNWANWNNHDQV